MFMIPNNKIGGKRLAKEEIIPAKEAVGSPVRISSEKDRSSPENKELRKNARKKNSKTKKIDARVAWNLAYRLRVISGANAQYGMNM